MQHRSEGDGGDGKIAKNRGKTTKGEWSNEANTQAWHGLPLHAHAPTTDAYLYIYVIQPVPYTCIHF